MHSVSAKTSALGAKSVEATLPPGPKAPPLVNALRWALQPIKFLKQCGDRFGDTFTVRFPKLPPYVFVSDPDSMRDIFNAEPDELQAGKVAGVMEPVFGKQALSLLDGERHIAERRMLTVPFHGERMQAYGDVMREIADDEIDRWPVGKPFPVHGPMQSLTLKVIFRGVLGTTDAESEQLRTLLTRLLNHAMNPVMLMPWTHVDLGPLTPYRAFMKTRGELDAILRQVIEERRLQDLSQRVDVLSMLIQAGKAGGPPMSTTSCATTWWRCS